VWPRSELTVNARLPVAQLVAAVEQRVPEHLARDRRQSVGAAGRATYSVRRKRPRLETRGGQLEVQVPLEATVDVCKPFGSACIHYGHCEPAFLATFRVPGAVGEDYRIAPPRGSLDATRPCVIGIDVTPQILREARKELSSVEAQLARSLPELTPTAASVWKFAQEPQEVAAGTCLRFVPSGIAHTPARIVGGDLEMAFELSGALALGKCEASAPPIPLPGLAKRAKATEPSRLWVPNTIPFHELGAAIEEQLTLPDASQLSSIEVRAHGERVALRLGVVGERCGDLWLSARPTFDGAGSELRLVDVRLEAPQAGPGSAFGAKLAGALTQVRLGVAPASEPSLELLRNWMRRAHDDLEGLEVQLTAGPPKEGRALVHAGGIGLASSHEIRAAVLLARLLAER
jgi:hypothetical protein